jgi:hypothetical protein
MVRNHQLSKDQMVKNVQVEFTTEKKLNNEIPVADFDGFKFNYDSARL